MGIIFLATGVVYACLVGIDTVSLGQWPDWAFLLLSLISGAIMLVPRSSPLALYLLPYYVLRIDDESWPREAAAVVGEMPVLEPIPE